MPSTPRSQRNLLGCTARAVENAAPWCLRHIEQWQCPMNWKGASASKATSPHRQLPRTVMVHPPLPPRVRRLGRVALGRSRRNGSRTATTSARCRRSSTTSMILRARAQARSGRRPHRCLRHRATIGAARDYLCDAHRAPGCGWLPEFVPASSKRIVEVHNIDSNEICARFEIERQDEALFTETLVLQGFEPYSGLPVPPRRFSSRHPCPFSADDLRSARLFYRKVRSGLPPHEYFAIAGGSLVAYYWTAYEPSLNGRAD